MMRSFWLGGAVIVVTALVVWDSALETIAGTTGHDAVTLEDGLRRTIWLRRLR